MSKETAKHTEHSGNHIHIWAAIGAIVLIVLLLIWLTVADFLGDTDVVAMIAPIL